MDFLTVNEESIYTGHATFASFIYFIQKGQKWSADMDVIRLCNSRYLFWLKLIPLQQKWTGLFENSWVIFAVASAS